MIRKTLTILSLIGLLLSVGLWGVSYFRFTWTSERNESCRTVQLSAGRLVYLVAQYGARPTRYLLDTNPPRQLLSSYGFDGFKNFSTRWKPRLFSSKASDGTPWTLLEIPLWIPTILLGLVLCLTRPFYQRRHRKRKKLGLCVNCGYDLRASKERCPECGDPFDER